MSANGHDLVSQRVQDRLADAGIEGYELYEVVSAGTGEPSRRMAQILATKAIAPCPEHTVMATGSFCPVCGTSHGRVDGAIFVSSADVGNAGVISAIPAEARCSTSAETSSSCSSDLNGVVRGGILRLCRH